MLVANVVVAFLPVLAFLAILVLMDSFKLARPSVIAQAIASGIAAAIICEALYPHLASTALSAAALSRYVAPVTEEIAKAVFIVYLVRRRRVGFPVDAAQFGFAAGTGFALVENLHYLRVFADAGIVLWIVRGLGTAVLHGAMTAIFAMLSQTAADRHPERKLLVFVPGLVAAIGIHAAFNHVPLPPMAMTALILIALPLLVLVVFQRSERATRDWVGAGLDLDFELLQLFSSDDFVHTRFSRYLRELRERLPGHVVADMLCLLRIELELSVQVKALLLAREQGATVRPHDDTRHALAELAYLRSSIGPTGLLALQPVQVTTHRDEWHRHLLAGEQPVGVERFRRACKRVASLFARGGRTRK